MVKHVDMGLITSNRGEIDEMNLKFDPGSGAAGSESQVDGV